jgi:D-3-phosphoglycerate dehydrogenase
LNENTRGLIGEAELAAMKPTAFLINVARGPIVDQAALTAALSSGALAGAGLDVFEKEPTDPDDPILKLDNVILGPHGLTWTDEAFRRVGETAIRSVLDVAAGKLPPVIVNRAVAESPALLNRLAGYGKGTN